MIETRENAQSAINSTRPVLSVLREAITDLPDLVAAGSPIKIVTAELLNIIKIGEDIVDDIQKQIPQEVQGRNAQASNRVARRHIGPRFSSRRSNLFRELNNIAARRNGESTIQGGAHPRTSLPDPSG